MTPSPKTTIRVDRTEVAQRGQKNGKPWVKYAVFGTLEDGSSFPQPGGPPFYTFDRLNAGEVEVSIESFTKTGSLDVQSFTIKRLRAPKQSRPAGGDMGQLDADRLEELTERVEQLESLTRRLATKLRLDEVRA